MQAEVTALRITPVKGTQIRDVESVRVDGDGVRENRRFFLIDEKNQMVNAKNLGLLNTIVSQYSDAERRLSVAFPDERVVTDEVRLGERITTGFYGEPFPARLVIGEWSEAISSHVGKSLRLVEAGDAGAVDRGSVGTVTLISSASVSRVAQQAQCSSIDSRRFRMLIEVDGIGAHDEDDWVGQTLRVGEVVLRAKGHVGRCVITNRDPVSGEVNLQTLKILGTYRRAVATTEPVAIGIHGEILGPGRIRIGDAVSLEPEAASGGAGS